MMINKPYIAIAMKNVGLLGVHSGSRQYGRYSRLRD